MSITTIREAIRLNPWIQRISEESETHAVVHSSDRNFLIYYSVTHGHIRTLEYDEVQTLELAKKRAKEDGWN